MTTQLVVPSEIRKCRMIGTSATETIDEFSGLSELPIVKASQRYAGTRVCPREDAGPRIEA